ncbi:hypothetical protein D3C81_1473220 [compost metagenome]
MLGLDFTGGQRHYPGFIRLAVKAIGRQLGVVGMRRNHHHPAPLQFDRRGYPQTRLAQQPAMTTTQAQRAGLQWRSQAGQVEESHAIDATLEGLPVGLLSRHQHNLRVEEPPEPAAFYPQLQHKGFIALQCAVSLEQPIVQADRNCPHLFTEIVGVVLAWRIEQVVGKPGLVGGPEQRQQQQRQPPPGQYTEGDQRDQAGQQAQALVAPMALEQLLLAAHA